MWLYSVLMLVKTASLPQPDAVLNCGVQAENIHIHTHMHTHTCIHTYIQIFTANGTVATGLKPEAELVKHVYNLPTWIALEEQFLQLRLVFVSTTYHQIIQLQLVIWGSQSFCGQEVRDRRSAKGVKFLCSSSSDRQQRQLQIKVRDKIHWKRVRVMSLTKST